MDKSLFIAGLQMVVMGLIVIAARYAVDSGKLNTVGNVSVYVAMIFINGAIAVNIVERIG